jgi:hypothetical protein
MNREYKIYKIGYIKIYKYIKVCQKKPVFLSKVLFLIELKNKIAGQLLMCFLSKKLSIIKKLVQRGEVNI